jgi:hypothetical protein
MVKAFFPTLIIRENDRRLSTYICVLEVDGDLSLSVASRSLQALLPPDLGPM